MKTHTHAVNVVCKIRIHMFYCVQCSTIFEVQTNNTGTPMRTILCTAKSGIYLCRIHSEHLWDKTDG